MLKEVSVYNRQHLVLTTSNKYHILCYAFGAPQVWRGNREPSETLGLSRSGKWKRPSSVSTGLINISLGSDDQ